MPRFRRRFRRRAKPRAMFRRARKLRRRAGKIQLRKKLRRDRKKRHNKYGYVFSNHVEAAINAVNHVDLAPSATTGWLGSYQDLQIMFDNIRQFEDVVWAAQTATAPHLPSNRHLLKMSVSGYCDYKIASGLTAGGQYVTVFIVKPKRNLPATSIGRSTTVLPGAVVDGNLNSAFQPTYENADGWNIVANNVQMTTPQTKPTIADTDAWVTPFMIPEFTQNFKVVKVLKYFLPAGGNIRFSLKLSERTISRHELVPTSASATGSQFAVLKKFGKAAFIRFHGEPSHDTTTHTTVNYGFASLDIVATKRYEFRYGSQATYFNIKNTAIAPGDIGGATKPGEAETKVEDL